MADKPSFDASASYSKPAFDPNGKYGNAAMSPEEATVASLPNAALQAKAQTQNSTPLGSNPTNLADKIAGAQATGALPPSNPQVDKLAPIVAGGGAAGLAEGALAKVGLAGAGGAVGDAAQQLTTTGKVNPVQSAEAGAGMAAGEGAGQLLSPLGKWLGSSKSTGATMLKAASEKAGSAPVNLSPETSKLIDQIMQEGRSGNSVPKVVSDLNARLGTNPNAPPGTGDGPLTYDEARSFQSNASRLSASESMAAKGQMKALVNQFAKSFGNDVQATADANGAGLLHRAGMQQYAQASAKGRVLDTAKDIATSKGAAAVGGGAVLEMLRRFGVGK